ncbi:hypothetical protein DEJ28_17855 [Curtobacterium sp. MCPF17_002]|uniref:hypothetical protein n=1 Tax=Curtobacterium sp. MCPF17_002 TaxID=2175645 RepID=UPI0011B49916|nr:hypothetical protein [Curtobacterium sp. MCPF17_002]WIB77484.1 hypothetical protein DEJ28_17855 [Curtobacterium sp. MCPF17_002]
MSNEAGRDPWRTIVGRPRIWQGIAWTLIGVLWLTLAVLGTETWRWVIGGVWTVLGGVLLTVAISDRRHGRGRYTATPLTVRGAVRPEDADEPYRR